MAYPITGTNRLLHGGRKRAAHNPKQPDWVYWGGSEMTVEVTKDADDVVLRFYDQVTHIDVGLVTPRPEAFTGDLDPAKLIISVNLGPVSTLKKTLKSGSRENPLIRYDGEDWKFTIRNFGLVERTLIFDAAMGL